MKVKELITKLEEFDEDAEVVFMDDNGLEYQIDAIWYIAYNNEVLIDLSINPLMEYSYE